MRFVGPAPFDASRVEDRCSKRRPLTRMTSGATGFSLVELLVVTLIIAILAAMATVAFLGASRSAQNRAAQSHAREAVATAKTLFTEEENYTVASAGALTETEPSLRFVDGGTTSDSPDVASVSAPDRHTFIVAVYSNSGICFFIRDEAVPTGRGTTYAEEPSNGTDCKALTPPGSFSRSW